MKTLVLLFLCLVAPLVYSNVIVDDFQESQTINYNTPNTEVQYTPTVGSNAYYARRITMNIKNPLDLTIGGGSASSVTNPMQIFDFVAFEYWFNPSVDYTPANQYNLPPGITRPTNPIPGNGLDLSNVVSLVLRIRYNDPHLDACFWFVSGDATGYTLDYVPFCVVPLIDGSITEIEVPIDTVFRSALDRTQVTLFKIFIYNTKWDFYDFYFKEACQSPANDNSAAAIPIPVNYAAPASFAIDTCGNCNAADFTGFQSGVQRDNVFWYSIAQQNTAYSVTFSSQSFSGFDDAYLFIFDGQGNLRYEIDNLEADEFAVTVAVNEIPIFVAFGANCALETYSLDVAFSSDINEVILRIEELEEALTGIINAGFTGVTTQIADISAELTTAEGNIIDEINQTETDIEGAINTETTQIDNSIAALATNLAGVNTNLQNLINDKFTDLNNGLTQSFGNVASDLSDISSQIDDQCGSATDGVTSLTTYLTSQWNNFKTLQMVDKLIPAAVVPAIYSTPASQGGLLDDVYTFVTSAYNTKKNYADSQKLTVSSCKAGADGAYCAFFYRYPSQTGSAQSTYQAALASYAIWMQQGRYAKAFQDLSTAYNALFIGQK